MPAFTISYTKIEVVIINASATISIYSDDLPCLFNGYNKENLPPKFVIHCASSVYEKVLENLNITEYKLINTQNDS